jgi:hypothetical protein
MTQNPNTNNSSNTSPQVGAYNPTWKVQANKKHKKTYSNTSPQAGIAWST